MTDKLIAVFTKSKDPDKFIPWEFAGFTANRDDVQFDIDAGSMKAEDVRVFDFDTEGKMEYKTSN